jgi:hypothetical protein
MRGAAGVVLDAGAFIALERRDRTMVALTQLFAQKRTPLVTSAGVVAQVWRGGAKQQAPLVFLLRRVEVVAMDYAVARTLGKMLGVSATSDPIDAHVVLLAREREWSVLTSDPGDLLTIDPTLVVEQI